MVPFAAVLRGEQVPWTAFDSSDLAFLERCRTEGLIGLLHHRATVCDTACDWPPAIRAALADEARRLAATELLREDELRAVLQALAAAGVRPLLLKGTALGQTHYPTPASRPRIDTDLLVAASSIEATRQTLEACGYEATNFCGGELFCQFPMRKTDRFGFVHKLDVHWKISTQPVFADALSYEEMAARALAIPALGPHARGPHPVHALVLACVHPAMHHRNVESLLWQYDVHLLVQGASDPELEEFVELAVSRRVAKVCAHQLDVTRRCFGTPFPGRLASRLAAATAEPSAAYLGPNRQWIDELVSSLQALPGWPERRRFLREIVFPSPRYMRGAYELPRSPLAAVLLPVTYAHRLAAGGWKILAGEK